MKPFEIFKPGTFTDNEGKQHSFTEQMLADAAAVYDPALHEAPLCVGHPANDAPAYGWVKGLAFAEKSLVAEPAEVEPAFSEIVQAGRYKKRSASFYPPAHPGNPKPGHWYLKHVAFLGAAAPAVKGLKSVAFSGGDEGVVTVEFSDAQHHRETSWVYATLGRALQAMREFMIAERGAEAADKAIPKWDVEEVMRAAGSESERARNKTSPSFSDPNPEDKVNPTQEQLDARKAELDAREAALAGRETSITTKEASFSEAEKKSRRTANEMLLDGLIEAGKFAPGLKASTLDFMDALDGATVVEFSEGEGRTVKKTPAEFFADMLKHSGKLIDFSELSPGTKQPPSPADPEAAASELARDAVAFAEAERVKGNIITIDQAVAAVAKQKEAAS